jgi:hypothetical protein
MTIRTQIDNRVVGASLADSILEYIAEARLALNGSEGAIL